MRAWSYKAPSMLRLTRSAVASSLDLDGRDDWDTPYKYTCQEEPARFYKSVFPPPPASIETEESQWN